MSPLMLVLWLILGSVTAYAGSVPTQCGRGRSHDRKRIVGGEISEDGDWPWLASVMVQWPEDDERKHTCGATLISPQWLVCAAHCFHTPIEAWLNDNPADYTIRVGEYDLYDEDQQHVDYTPEKIIKHNNFDGPDSMTDDIALIKLPTPVEMTDRVNVACLPDDTYTFPDKCTIAGWGHQVYNGTVSNVVRHAEVSVVDATTCFAMYAECCASWMSSWASCICAGNFETGAEDACQFDSGGPLACYDGEDEKWTLSGVVSFGAKCGDKDHPGIYTNVQAYMPWIEATIAAN